MIPIPFSYFKPSSIYEPEVVAFLAATGISDSTIENALNDLVVSFKNILGLTLGFMNLKTKFKAIYPLVGGDSVKHSYNLVDPNTYQGVFNNSVTHDANGVHFGSDGYMDSTLIPSIDFFSDAFSVGGYSRTESTTNSFDFSALNSSSQRVSHRYKNTSNVTQGWGYVSAFIQGGTPTSTGLNVLDKNNANTLDIFRNGVGGLAAGRAGSRPTVSIYFGAQNVNGTPAPSTERNYAFWFIADTLSTVQLDLYNAIQTFETTLNRQV